MRFAPITLMTLLSSLLAFGCANETGDPDGPPIVDPAGDDDDDIPGGITCDDLQPPGPFGANIDNGEFFFRPFTLPSCGGEMVELYGDSFCAANEDGTLNRPKATVIGLAAQWCGPCVAETREFVSGFAQEYQDQGVRFLQILAQDFAGATAQQDDCDEWLRDVHHANSLTGGSVYPTLLDTPIENVMDNHLRNTAWPWNVVLDSEGRVRYAKSAFREAEVRALLDTLVAQ